MFDSDLNGQHRLNYLARGPEFAFAIPAGDLDVLEEVMGLCSGFWNGAGSLIVPVTKAGRLDPHLGHFLAIRPVDRCWIHPSLGDRARAAVERAMPCAPLHPLFDENEVHPLLLAPPPADPSKLPALFIPELEGRSLRRLALALWGTVFEEDLPEWHNRYAVLRVDGERALDALVHGQSGSWPNSPLRLTQSAMGIAEQMNPLNWPWVIAFDPSSFRQLVNFWNFRARTLSDANGASVIGLSRRLLSKPERLTPLAAWAAPLPGVERIPEVFLAAPPRLIGRLEAALEGAGFEREESGERRETWGSQVTARAAPTFRSAALGVGGHFIRGSAANELIAIAAGQIVASLPQPPGLDLGGGHQVRVVLRNLPLPLPISPSAARRMHEHGVASDGLMLHLGAFGRPWGIDLRLPDRHQALGDWATDVGYSTAHTQDGRYAEAILARLGNLSALDPLADPLAVELLRTLAPRSRKKLAQRLVREAKKDGGGEITEERLLEGLRDVGIFLELEARPRDALASALGQAPAETLAALEPLVDLGLVRRGLDLRCPECNYRTVFGLGELDERLVCHACGREFPLPTRGPGGREEHSFVYRLDGLAARAMDQDLLPVLLALRTAARTFAAPRFYAWPGVEFSGPGGTIDVDLLCSNGEDVWAFEVKDNAASLKDDQLARLLDLADRLSARPALAGLRNNFTASQHRSVGERNGLVFEAADLLIPVTLGRAPLPPGEEPPAEMLR
jgi:hypothetical protein